MAIIQLVQEYVSALAIRLAQMTPQIIGAIIVLVIGWIIGRVFGKAIAKLLDRVGADDALRKTAIGKALDKTKLKVVGLFELLARWFVYLIAILAAVDILQIAMLSNFVSAVVQYIPSFIAGLIILFAGFFVADFVGDSMTKIGREGKLEYTPLFAGGLRMILYLLTLIITLTMWKIDVSILNTFASATAWGLALGVGIALGIAFGWGLKDVVAKRAEGWIDSFAKTKQK